MSEEIIQKSKDLVFAEAIEALPDLANHVNQLRNAAKKSTHEKSQSVLNFIRTSLNGSTGSFHFDFVTFDAYYFDGKQKKLIAIHKENLMYRTLMAQFALNPTEKIYEYVTSALGQYSFSHATEQKDIIGRCSHYNPDTNELQVFDNDAAVFQITVDSVKTVDNGSGGVLFLSYPNTEKIKITDEPRIASPDSNT